MRAQACLLSPRCPPRYRMTRLLCSPRPPHAQPGSGQPARAVTRGSLTSLEDHATTVPAWGGPRTLFGKVTLETSRVVQWECGSARAERKPGRREPCQAPCSGGACGLRGPGLSRAGSPSSRPA